MLLSLTPVVYGGNHKKWTVGASLHLLGGAIGGAVVGLALSPVALLPIPRYAWIVAAAFFGVAALSDLGVTRRRMYPSPRRQVPEGWRKLLPGHPVFLLYGIGLGAGFFTRNVSAALYAATTFALATGKPLTVILILALFGLCRSMSAVLPAGMLYPQERAGRLVACLSDYAARASAVGGLAVTAAVAYFIGITIDH